MLDAKIPCYKEEMDGEGSGQGEEMHSVVPSPPSTGGTGPPQVPMELPAGGQAIVLAPWKNLVAMAVPMHPV